MPSIERTGGNWCTWTDYRRGSDDFYALSSDGLNVTVKNARGTMSYDDVKRILRIPKGADALIDPITGKTILENPVGTYTASEIRALKNKMRTNA